VTPAGPARLRSLEDRRSGTSRLPDMPTSPFSGGKSSATAPESLRAVPVWANDAATMSQLNPRLETDPLTRNGFNGGDRLSGLLTCIGPSLLRGSRGRCSVEATFLCLPSAELTSAVVRVILARRPHFTLVLVSVVSSAPCIRSSS